MIRKAILLALAVTALAAEPALAQRGGHDRGGSHNGDHGDHNRGRDHDRGSRHGGSYYGGGYGGYGHYRHGRHDDGDWILGLSLGLGVLSLLDAPDYYDPAPGYSGYSGYSGYAQPAWNEWGLAPRQCRWDREFGYWYNRPADVEVQRCADANGSVYVVQGSHRLWRYR